MGMSVNVSRLSYRPNKDKKVLDQVSLQVSEGAFVALLGENGAGKTSLLDLVMGFKPPTSGTIQVDNQDPFQDHWQSRQSIAYLSEKMDLPGDWSVQDFLEFNRFFYKDYSLETEAKLAEEFRLDLKGRLGSFSAGELRRVQLVAALSIRPKLVVIDEITAVLDIVGRQKLMKTLRFINEQQKCTVILATNILEDLVEHISHVVLISKGKLCGHHEIGKFLNGKPRAEFSSLVAQALEGV